MDEREKVVEERAERRNEQRENWWTEGHGGAGVPRVMVIASEYTKAPPEELPRVLREEAPAARGCGGEERVASEQKRGRKAGRHEEEDRNLLGSECNFIVNLSLSEGKQWSDLRTICPCHLYLHLAYFFAPPFSPCSPPLSPPPAPPSRKVRRSWGSGAAVSPHRIYRARTRTRRELTNM